MNATPLEKSLKSQAYFPALTGVRALAAYLVFIQHNRPDINITENFARTYLNTGHTGVTIFFVLSGFLITYRYADGFIERKVNLKQYFGKRFARILPLYLLLTTLLLLWQRDFDLWHWFLNLTLLKGFFYVEKDTAIFQAWSLTVEETFYLLAPVLFIFFRKYALLSLAVLLSFGAGMVLFANAFGSVSFFADLEFMLIYTFFGRCFEFYCGYRLATFIKARNANPNSDTQKKSAGFKFTLPGALGILIIYLGLNLSGKFELRIWQGIPVEVLLNNFVLPVPIAVFFYGLITETNLFTRLFASKPAQLLGRSSYAFYLIHAGLFYEFFYFRLSHNKFIIFLALNIAAIGLYKLVEEPANKIINNLILRKRFDLKK